jgi:hypothetical protein
VRYEVFAGEDVRADGPLDDAVRTLRFGDAYTLTLGQSSGLTGPRDRPFVIDYALARAPGARPARVFLHLGAADAPPLAQFDADLAPGPRLRHGVDAQHLSIDRVDVWLGLVDAETGERLRVSGAPHIDQRVRLGTLILR